MAEVDKYWHETYFCWIGAFKREDGFYFKVYSPVIMLEFDHYSGVFLNNALLLPFYIHTLVRTPNGNDYSKELLRRLYYSLYNILLLKYIYMGTLRGKGGYRISISYRVSISKIPIGD
ncbi:uncharacterized protein NECHADRAFT_89476 [Fusarium vanettenii 77-13-4]|uniref:Uncharacterized protein n=1 Tax=Fusarium vanettenii (strain ATCC MYA-4622 / CBS 123669 / FGSC 9596 / NRRL 45880 / 77-13-4) TaxID=660122 RepID=C7ZRA8_FUSV7|nr:uncharacterized protein NECHADRAFT_89476 [Fusarium vanettenii 77-13-4]EEU33447.1 hypothetical protein NECHADRAFT_89476 [Fusarium vanettenii 77-13-4]